MIIGKKIIITKSPNKYEVGIKGLVVDETKNSIVILTKKGEKRIIKKSNLQVKESE